MRNPGESDPDEHWPRGCAEDWGSCGSSTWIQPLTKPLSQLTCFPARRGLWGEGLRYPGLQGVAVKMTAAKAGRWKLGGSILPCTCAQGISVWVRWKVGGSILPCTCARDISVWVHPP